MRIIALRKGEYMKPDGCIAIVSTMHGRYRYYAAVRYVSRSRKDGVRIWARVGVLVEYTSHCKVLREAEELSKTYGLPLLPDVRHNAVI